MNKKGIGMLVATALMTASISIPVHAAQGDIYDTSTTPPTDHGSISSIILKDKATLFKMITNMANYGYEISGNIYRVSDVNTDFIDNQAFTQAQLQADVKLRYKPVEAVPSATTLKGTFSNLLGQSYLSVSLPNGVSISNVTKNGKTLTLGSDYSVNGTTLSIVNVTQADAISITDSNGTVYTVASTANISTISNIPNIAVTVNQGSSYNLPSTVQAIMSDGTAENMAVIWNNEASTSQAGTFTFNGTVNGYSGTVILTLTVNAKSVAVTSVSLNKGTDTLTVGGTDTLSATITPINATNQQVEWTSSNPSVLTVNNGIIKGISAGTAIITADTADGNKSATCAVTVTDSNITNITNITELQDTLTNAIISGATSVKVTYNGNDPLAGYPNVLGTVVTNIISTPGNDYEKLLLNKYSYSATSIKGSNQFTANYSLGYLETATQSAQVKAKVDTILSQIIAPGMTDEQIEKAINDWICKNVAYDTTLTNDTAYAALFGNGKTICEGYSLLAYRMLTEAGLDARIVTGTGNGESHAWNMVKINGTWYHLDVTWDDPVPDVPGRTTYTYFNLDDAQMRASGHTWTYANYPTCNTVFVPTDPNLLKP
jgi:hypothetical protein